MNTKLKSDKNGPLLLLAEGADDKFVVIEILRANGISDYSVFVKDMVGVETLLQTLPVEIKGSGVTHLGIVIDADENISGRWQRIKDILANVPYPALPDVPASIGTIVAAEDFPTIGIWIMPDNETDGMLEHFISYLRPENDDLWEDAVSAVGAVIASGKQRFPDAHRIKAEAHTWLAWQADPGVHFGVALAKKYLDPSCVEGELFFDWLKRPLFPVNVFLCNLAIRRTTTIVFVCPKNSEFLILIQCKQSYTNT